MEFYQIEGGTPLRGEYHVKGAKNAALPIMAASICCPGVHRLCGCPRIEDVFSMERILRYLGVKTFWEYGGLVVDTSEVTGTEVPEPLMEGMRSSIFLLGSLLARCGQAKIHRPGGCRIGSRPIDLHLAGLVELGFEVSENGSEADCRGCCRGGSIRLPYPSVGATENLMMAALAGKHDTTIENCAAEPEIADLAGFLKNCGFEIYGAGSGTIFVKGGAENIRQARQSAFKQETDYFILEDRVEAATYLMSVMGTGGEILLRGIRKELLEAVLAPLKQMGAQLQSEADLIFLRAPQKMRSPGVLVTAPYPGFPTDCQPQMMSLVCGAEGRTMIREEIFENRFLHKKELAKMGANIEICGKNAIIKGVCNLHGSEVCATDLRGGAALVAAGLMAEGKTIIRGIEHIDRGYEKLHTGIRELGGKIERRT